MRPRRAQASYFHRRSKEEDKEEERMEQPFFVHVQHIFTVGQLPEKQAGSPDPRQADSRPEDGLWEVKLPIPITAMKSARRISSFRYRISKID